MRVNIMKFMLIAKDLVNALEKKIVIDELLKKQWSLNEIEEFMVKCKGGN